MKKAYLLSVMVGFALALAACAPAPAAPTYTPSPAPTQTAAATASPNPSPTEPDTGWDYVALGDSNPAGAGVSRSYVAIYAKYIGEDLGVEVREYNQAFNGATSSIVLAKLKKDTQLQQEIREAEVVTLDVGANDWATVAHLYPFQKCGGADNEDCLRTLMSTYSKNLEAILDEIDVLHGTEPPVLLRIVDLYLSDCDFPALFEDPKLLTGITPYLGKFNAGIAEEAAAHHGQVVPLYLTLNGPDGTHNPVEFLQNDQCHLSPGGHQTVAEMLRKMGYEK